MFKRIEFSSPPAATDAAGRDTDRRSCFCIDFDCIDYRAAWNLQTDLIDARLKNGIAADIVLFLEHPPVFTLGRRGGDENLLVSPSLLEKSGMAVIQVERGGNITYHGPGQLVVYPIMDVHAARLAVVELVGILEEVMLRTVAFWGIAATRNPINRGVWVGAKKMGSVGIAIRKGISFHGLALNVNVDLTPFGWIQPCGLSNVRMTSMKQQLGRQISMVRVRETLKKQLETTFGLRFATIRPADLAHIFKIEEHTIPKACHQNHAQPF